MPLYGTLIYKTVFSIVRASLWKSQKDPTKQSFKIYKWNSMLYRKCHISKNSENWNGQREKIRSSRPKVFCKKCVLRIFTKFTGKHLCQSLFFNKVAGLRKKWGSGAQVFSSEFCEISKNTTQDTSGGCFWKNESLSDVMKTMTIWQ